MSLLRFTSLVVLGVWIGGLAVLGLVGAPTIFSVLEGLDPVGGRETAGVVFGAVFEQFQHVAWVLGGLLVAVLVTRAVLGPRPRRFAWRVGTSAAMLALSAVSGLVLAPQIDAIRDAVQGPVAALPDSDGRKAEFGRLHGFSNGFALLTMLGGAWLIWMEMSDDKH